MSYREPTPQEIALSQCLQGLAAAIDEVLKAESGGEVDFLLVVSPRRTEPPAADVADQPVSSYVASMDRETAAMVLIELMAKWQANDELKPLHQLRDASGKSLAEILGAGAH